MDSGGGGEFHRDVAGLAAVAVLLAAVVLAGLSFVLGLGNEEQTYGPQADFSFEYEVVERRGGEDWGVLTVTHECGDPIPKTELAVRGDGFGESATPSAVRDRVDPPPDMVERERWNGSASGTYETEAGDVREMVVLGDSARVYLDPSYRVEVRWLLTERESYGSLRGVLGPRYSPSGYKTLDEAVGPRAEWPTDESPPTATDC